MIIEQKEDKQEMKEVIMEQCEHSKKMLDIAIEQQYLAKDQAEEQQEHNKKVLELAQEQKDLAQEQKDLAQEQKELTIEQKELTIEQNENHKELMKQIKDKGLGTTTINNNQFNLNFFLNDTCKDAMNLTDLYKVINDFKMPHHLILAFEKTNHATGISNCIDGILDSVPMNKRPIHCSDFKREVMHYKNNDIWEKEKEIIAPFEVMLIRIFRNQCNDNLTYYRKHFMDTEKSEKDEDTYNSMVMHTYYGGDALETTKIKTRLAKRTCIVREKD